MILTCI